MTINKIAHLADIHIMNKLTTHEEVRQVHENTIKLLSNIKPDVIIITGDLFHDNLDCNNEAETLGGRFLNNLSNIARVIITQGNHDINRQNPDRLDSIQNIINLIDNPKVKYLNKTEIISDDEDTTINYAVWHHIDKTSPWENYTKENDIFYIDIFHDPVNGCLAENSQRMEESHYRNLSDFKGNIALFGDIHKQQDFHKDGKLFATYPSSLYETKYSEGDADFHGFVIWDITDKSNPSIEKIRVENKYSHHNYTITQDFDYDNISFNIDRTKLTEYSRLSIKWIDYQSIMNNKNERHIRAHIKKEYPNIKEIKIERKTIYVSKITTQEQELLNNINDRDVQRKAFVDFLKAKKWSDAVINDVLEVDNIVNNKLTNEDIENVINTIKIISFEFNYFRSYGENNKIGWNKKDGVYQITGFNANGKSTIYYFIMYMLFGKIPSSIKEKNSDNKFINNRLDVDFCDGNMILEINNNFYKIVKKTEQKWNRTKTEITSVPTSIQYLRVDELGNILEDENESSNETDKNKTKTQALIEKSIGSYEDFIRKVYTDADNLNNLLSNDKAQFINNILFDTGLDIFDKKFEYYKEYKNYLSKTTKIEKINIKPEDEKEKIDKLLNTINDSKNEIIHLKVNDLIQFSDRVKKGNLLKEDEIKKLHKIDERLISISISELTNEIKNLNLEWESKKSDLILLENKINACPTSYDKEGLEKMLAKIEAFKEWRLKKLEEINKIKLEIDTNKNKKESLNREVESIKREITHFHNTIDNKIASKKLDIVTKINDNDNKKSIIENDNTSLEKDIIRYNKSIEQERIFIQREIDSLVESIDILKNSKSEDCEDKSCPTCKRTYGNTELEIISQTIKEKEENITIKKNLLVNNETINNYSSKIETANITIKNNLNKIEEIISDSNNLNSILNKIADEAKNDEDIIDIYNIIKLSQNKIDDILLEIPTFDVLNNSLLENIQTIETDVKTKTEKGEEYNIAINAIQKVKLEVEAREKLIQTKDNYPTIIENIILKIENKNRLLEDYNTNISKIEENKTIEIKIKAIADKIILLENERQQVVDKITNIENYTIPRLENEIKSIEELLQKFAIQEHKINVDKAYQECIHRDGLPTTLLKKLLPNINNELLNLLSGANFKLFFDEDINLRMSNNKYESTQNVLDGSGMERTFISFVLKLTLMKISNKSRYNMLLLDEVTSKLDLINIENFKALLAKTKDFIDKVIIIDHYNDFNPDYLIKVNIDENDISHIEFN